jgi:hypothetical protein
MDGRKQGRETKGHRPKIEAGSEGKKTEKKKRKKKGGSCGVSV